MRIKATSKIIGIVSGAPIYSMFGSDVEIGEDQSQDQNQDQQGEEADADQDDDDEENDSRDDDRLRKANRQAARRRHENAELAKENENLRKQLDAENRKKQDKVTNAEKDVSEANEKIARLEKNLGENLISTGILRDSKRSWHDDDAVIAKIDFKELTIDLDGRKVEGLDDELARIAKEFPFLVRETKGKKQGDASKKEGEQKPNGSSGSNPGSPGVAAQVSGSNIKREDMQRRIPALRR